MRNEGLRIDEDNRKGTKIEIVSRRRAVPPLVRLERVRSRLPSDARLRAGRRAGLELGVSEVTVRADLDALAARAPSLRVHGGAMPRRAIGLREPRSRRRRRPAPPPSARSARRPPPLVRRRRQRLSSTSAAPRSPSPARCSPAATCTTSSSSPAGSPSRSRSSPPSRGSRSSSPAARCGRCSTRSWTRSRPMLERCNSTSPSSAATASTPTRGVTNVNLPEARSRRRMLRAADAPRSLVADGSEARATSHLGRVAALDEFDTLVTGAAAADAARGASSRRPGSPSPAAAHPRRGGTPPTRRSVGFRNGRLHPSPATGRSSRSTSPPRGAPCTPTSRRSPQGSATSPSTASRSPPDTPRTVVPPTGAGIVLMPWPNRVPRRPVGPRAAGAPARHHRAQVQQRDPRPAPLAPYYRVVEQARPRSRSPPPVFPQPGYPYLLETAVRYELVGRRPEGRALRRNLGADESLPWPSARTRSSHRRRPDRRLR